MKKTTIILPIFFLACLPPGIVRAGDTHESLSPVTTCGWIKNVQTGNDVIAALIQGLEELGGKDSIADGTLSKTHDGIAFYIKAVNAPRNGERTTIWCITQEGAVEGENMVNDLARSFAEPETQDSVSEPPPPDAVPAEQELARTLTQLVKGGYRDFVRDNIDLVALYIRPFTCSQISQECYGEAHCGFTRTARLAFRTLAPGDAAALWVHEAAHLEGCYNDEEYARSKELDFKARIRGGAGRVPEAQPSPW